MANSSWNKVSAPQFHEHCISMGHLPYVHETGFGKITLYCERCSRYWRIEVRKIDWMAEDAWRGKDPELFLTNPVPATILEVRGSRQTEENAERRTQLWTSLTG